MRFAPSGFEPGAAAGAEYYQALLARDGTYEGTFIAAVRTTGIFCRPTCRARKPKRENVAFYPTTGAALQAGYRACKVCRPLEAPGATPAAIHDLLREIHADPVPRITDAQLRDRGLVPSALRRWFLRQHGRTFHAYQRGVRLGAAFEQLQRGESVTATAFGAGYESLSGFQESFKAVFGTAPSHSRRQQVIHLTRLETPLGTLVAGGMAEGICLLEFADRKSLETEFRDLAKRLNAAIVPGENPHFPALRQQLAEYFGGQRRAFSVPLVAPGTAFQQAAWAALQAIPCGETRTYQQQAVALGRASAQRAVAATNGLNRISILVPCHRVVGTNGHLTGYGGGLWRKKWLLALEAKPESVVVA